MLNRASAPPAKPATSPRRDTAARSRRGGRPPFWRNPLLLGALTVIVVVVAVIAGVANAHQSNGGGASSQGRAGASQTVLDAVTDVNPAVVAAVGGGGLPTGFYRMNGAQALTGPTGKPEVLYIGAEYCPYCAAQRWATVVALSRFGTFQHLYLTQSSSTDVYPDTATFTFQNVGYTSRYLDFVPVETEDRSGNPLQTPTQQQTTLLTTYDAPPYVPASSAGGNPWLDVANQDAMVSSGYSPQVLAGLTWGQIAQKLSNANDPVTRAIVGEANIITAAICHATGAAPGVCSTPAIQQLVRTLP